MKVLNHFFVEVLGEHITILHKLVPTQDTDKA